MQVTAEQGQMLAEKINCPFLEINSNNQKAVEELYANVFEELKKSQVTFRRNFDD